MWQVIPTDHNTGREDPENALQYSADTLVQQFIGKIAQSTVPSYDQQMIINAMEQRFSVDVLMNCTPGALMETAFRMGYLYRVFLERNNVVYPKNPSDQETIPSS